MPKTQIIILAAGHGKRMQSELPKALTPLQEKPFIKHVLDTVALSGVCQDPIIVVGQKREQVMEALGNNYKYVVQDEQLGTGHAVMMAEGMAKGAETVIILYADQPLVSAETIRNLVAKHESENATLTMATAKVEDFLDWRASFLSFSRLIRNEEGGIARVVEAKDATEIEKEIKEINPCYFCFDAKWMWEHLHTISNENMQKEYYLTDLVGMAFTENKKISSIKIDVKEALGVNTKEQLEMLTKLLDPNI